MLEPNFSKFEKNFLTITINATLIFLIVGLLFLDITNTGQFGDNSELLYYYFYLCVASLALFIVVPFIGKTIAGKKINFLRLIIYVLILKILVVVVFEVIDFYQIQSMVWDRPFLFPGDYDFQYGYQYVHCFLTNTPCSIPVNIESVNGYYPPGVAFIYIFLTTINPAEWSFLYRFYMLFFEAGTWYLIYAIAKIPKLHIAEKLQTKGVIYSFFTVSFIFMIDFYAKYDSLVVFLTLLGMYFFLTDRPYVSAIIWTFCVLVKLYTILWIFGVLIHHLKKRRYADFIRYTIICLLTGSVTLGIATLFEGLKFFQVLFQFGFQLQGAYVLQVENIWFYLIYTGLPGTNLIPYLLLFSVFIIFTFKWKGELTPDFFMRVTAITLFFYPAVNSSYLQWLMPMICITMLGSVKKVQVLAALEIGATFAELSSDFYCLYNGISLPVILSFTAPPSIILMVWRFVNLGLFLLILATLIIPERFSKYFPEMKYETISLTENKDIV